MKVRLNLNRILVILGVVVGLFFIAFFIWWNRDFEISNGDPKAQAQPKSQITGENCENSSKRPVGLMLAGDLETRPLSGISQADIVFEMPVSPDGMTRFMAIFQCEDPKEIGSIRSARDDFIPLAASFNVIYGHWGGERDALTKLDRHVVDNVDALKYEGSVYFRKSGIPRPHNGFTTLSNMYDQASRLGYSLESKFIGYPHISKKGDVPKNLGNIVDQVSVGVDKYLYPVVWRYDVGSNMYIRSRNNVEEKDRNTSGAAKASVIVIMHTSSARLGGQYIKVDVVGQGKADIYQNGELISGTWQKDSATLDSKLRFLDSNNQEIQFVPGKIWVQIVAN